MSSASTPGLLGCAEPLTRHYDVALLDLDGVVYLGSQAVPGAPEALAGARESGMRLAFVTNNAARTPDVVAAHLTELGIPAQQAEVTTSAQAAARYLAERLSPGAAVLVVGTVGLLAALRERGLEPVEQDRPDVAAVVQGYSPELTWRQLAEGAVAINRGVLWVATNLDPTVPSPRGRLPGNGALVAALRHATGVEPVSTGKPDPTMHRESVDRSGARNPLVVGDRLDTDIEGANAARCASLLVFTGVTSPAELLAAPERLRPDYLAPDVSGLLQAHPQPELTDAGFACGSWSAGVQENGTGLLRSGPATSASSDGLDALRAMCAAAWQHRAEVVRWTPADTVAAAKLTELGLG
ncbi:MAG TPA: HAD-IIA family hydrolase [Mycobacteriales bacterium]|nr:HAD-IIA family hydrolase [Mycobacteriales bacterium]